MKLFVSLIEVEPIAPAALSGAIGASVRVYVISADEQSALEAIEAELSARGLGLTAVEWMVDDANTDWENPASPGGERLRLTARSSGEVTFDLFHSWQK
jgi:hypothetical protein